MRMKACGLMSMQGASLMACTWLWKSWCLFVRKMKRLARSTPGHSLTSQGMIKGSWSSPLVCMCGVYVEDGSANWSLAKLYTLRTTVYSCYVTMRIRSSFDDSRMCSLYYTSKIRAKTLAKKGKYGLAHFVAGIQKLLHQRWSSARAGLPMPDGKPQAQVRGTTDCIIDGRTSTCALEFEGPERNPTCSKCGST